MECIPTLILSASEQKCSILSIPFAIQRIWIHKLIDIKFYVFPIRVIVEHYLNSTLEFSHLPWTRTRRRNSNRREHHTDFIIIWLRRVMTWIWWNLQVKWNNSTENDSQIFPTAITLFSHLRLYYRQRWWWWDVVCTRKRKENTTSSALERKIRPGNDDERTK